MRKLIFPLFSLMLLFTPVIYSMVEREGVVQASGSECTPEANQTDMTNAQINHYFSCLGIDMVNVNGLSINYDLVRERGIVVYGNHTHVSPNNNSPNGWRYFGQTLSGERYMNMWFPPDALATTNMGTRNWIERPWEDADAVRNSNKPEATWWMDHTPESELVAYLNTIVDKYTAAITGNPYDRGNWEAYGLDGYWMLDYAVINQPPTRFGPGMVTLWHRGSTQDWYDTFFIPPLERLFEDDEDIPCTAGFCSSSESNVDRYIVGSATFEAPPYTPIYETQWISDMQYVWVSDWQYEWVSDGYWEWVESGYWDVDDYGNWYWVDTSGYQWNDTSGYQWVDNGGYQWVDYGYYEDVIVGYEGTEYTDYFYEQLSISITGPFPRMVKAGKGTEITAISFYNNDFANANPSDYQKQPYVDEDGVVWETDFESRFFYNSTQYSSIETIQNNFIFNKPLGPNILRLTAYNTEDWSSPYVETIDLITEQTNPALHWGDGKTVEWKIPYAHFTKDGYWTRHEDESTIFYDEYEFGGLQRWYFGFDVPDGEEFSLSVNAQAGLGVNACHNVCITIEGSPYDEFIIRSIDPSNPFPTGDVGINWIGTDHEGNPFDYTPYITNLIDWYNFKE